jgi:hypothetical protein
LGTGVVINIMAIMATIVIIKYDDLDVDFFVFVDNILRSTIVVDVLYIMLCESSSIYLTAMCNAGTMIIYLPSPLCIRWI